MVDGLFTNEVPAWRAHDHVLNQLSEVRDEFHASPEEKEAVHHFDVVTDDAHNVASEKNNQAEP